MQVSSFSVLYSIRPFVCTTVDPEALRPEWLHERIADEEDAATAGVLRTLHRGEVKEVRGEDLAGLRDLVVGPDTPRETLQHAAIGQLRVDGLAECAPAPVRPAVA